MNYGMYSSAALNWLIAVDMGCGMLYLSSA